MSNISDEINVIVDCKLDQSGVEDFQKELKSYDIGKEFNYAVAIIEILIIDKDNEKEINNTIEINVAPKIQYIIPFVSKKLAEKYLEELSTLKRLTMFLSINEDGKVDLKKNDIENNIYNN